MKICVERSCYSWLTIKILFSYYRMMGRKSSTKKNYVSFEGLRSIDYIFLVAWSQYFDPLFLMFVAISLGWFSVTLSVTKALSILTAVVAFVIPCNKGECLPNVNQKLYSESIIIQFLSPVLCTKINDEIHRNMKSFPRITDSKRKKWIRVSAVVKCIQSKSIKLMLSA